MSKTSTATAKAVTAVEENKEQPKEQKSKYSQDELLVIFDSIMFEGEYREDVTIKGKLRVTFKTRSGADTSAITRDLDSKQFNLMSSMEQYRALLSMGYSLTRYHDKDISGMTLENRLSFIEKLPTVVVAAISNALVEFDMKTEAALMEQDAF